MSAPASSSSSAKPVEQLDRELAQLEARIKALNSEKHAATLNKAIGEASPEELERLARQLRAERKQAAETAARAELHNSFAEHPNPKVRESLKAISAWGKEELCALEDFSKDIADKRKKVGIFGARAPYEPTDVMPYTRAELESRTQDSTERGLELITSVLELFHAMHLPTGELHAVAAQAANIASNGVKRRRRALDHARRGCECLPENCNKQGGAGHSCKCTTAGILCDQRCNCGGSCTNPKNVAEPADDKEYREAWVEGKLTQREEKLANIIKLAERAATAAAMQIDTKQG